MEATPIDNEMFFSWSTDPKKIVAAKTRWEGRFDSTVLGTVLAQPEVIEELRGAVEMKGGALLLEGEGCQPDGNEPILTVG